MEPGMPNIIDALIDDLPEILTLQKLCYSENALRYGNDNIRPMIQTHSEIEKEFSRAVFLKAMEGGRIVGSIRAYLTGATCFIVRLFVHPDRQNRGIGSALMNTIEQRFHDVDRYELFTGYKDEKNLHLYMKLGYTRFREERREDGMIFYFLQKPNRR